MSQIGRHEADALFPDEVTQRVPDHWTVFTDMKVIFTAPVGVGGAEVGCYYKVIRINADGKVTFTKIGATHDIAAYPED